MTGGAIQAAGNGCRDMFADFGLCTQRPLRGVRAVVAGITTRGRRQQVVHGFQGKGYDRHANGAAVEFVMATIALDARNRDMPGRVRGAFGCRSVMATQTITGTYQRVIDINRRPIEGHEIAGVELRMAYIASLGGQHMP